MFLATSKLMASHNATVSREVPVMRAQMTELKLTSLHLIQGDGHCRAHAQQLPLERFKLSIDVPRDAEAFDGLDGIPELLVGLLGRAPLSLLLEVS